MKPSDAIISFIKGYEKLSLIAYLPTPKDKYTISWGLTRYPSGAPVKKGDKITIEQAEQYFREILNNFALEVSKLILKPISQPHFDSLLDLSYNIGIENFKNSTVLRLVNKDPLDENILKHIREWDKQDGEVLPGLVKRREAEILIYTKGIYNSNH